MIGRLAAFDRRVFGFISSKPLLSVIVSLIMFGVIWYGGAILYLDVMPVYLQWVGHLLFGSLIDDPIRWWQIPLLPIIFFVGFVAIIWLTRIPEFIRRIRSYFRK